MNGFSKFKNKILLECLIKSIVFGFTSALITFSFVLIYLKLKEISFNVLYLLLVSFGVFLVIFSIIYLLLKPNNKKIAKRLDKELNLNEKVQTMIEYSNEDNFMISIQREDTLNILSNISTKKLTMKFGVLFFVVIVIASLSSITAFAIPTKEEEIIDPEEDEIPDLDYELDNWQAMAILGIIEVVEDADINPELKNSHISDLKGLLDALEDAKKESQMKELVNNVITSSKLKLDLVNSNNEIFTVIRTTENPTVSQIGVKINSLNAKDVGVLIENIYYVVGNDEQAIRDLDSSFGKLLRDSNLDVNDNLVKLLLSFCDGLKNAKSAEDIALVIANYKEKIVDEISLQARNKEITDFMESELIDIFGLKEENQEDDNETQQPDEDPDDEHKNQGENSGGGGTGDVLFGSDDLFFDPEKGSVEYGDVITTYYGEIIAKLNDGTISEEYRKYLEQYFDILFGDFNKTDE